MPQEDMEFFDPMADDSSFEWEPVPEHPPGSYQMIMYEDEDRITRFMLKDPGAESNERFVHDFYEEILILEGGLIDKTTDEVFTEGMYACRTPGMEHGPYAAPVGCLSYEHRYWE